MRMIFLSILMLVFDFALAQSKPNCFIYIRYDYPTNNYSKLHSEIERLYEQTSEKCVVFYDGKFAENQKVRDLIDGRDFLSSTTIYNANAEMESISNFFTRELTERIDKTSTKIYGEGDNRWSIVFIMSKNDEFADLCKLLNVSNIDDRNIDVNFIVYDDNTQIEKLRYSDVASDNNLLNINLLKF